MRCTGPSVFVVQWFKSRPNGSLDVQIGFRGHPTKIHFVKIWITVSYQIPRCSLALSFPSAPDEFSTDETKDETTDEATDETADKKTDETARETTHETTYG